jgi:predicted RNase H-like HicB family nuclease
LVAAYRTRHTDSRVQWIVRLEEGNDGDRERWPDVRLPAVVTLERDDLGPVYVARCLAVEVASHGDTHEQALANLREALELYFEDSPVPDVDVNPELASVDVRIPA